MRGARCPDASASSKPKFFTITEPTGKSHGASPAMPTTLPAGVAKKRCLNAPSVQSGLFTSYGTSSGAGVSTSSPTKQPVSRRVGGTIGSGANGSPSAQERSTGSGGSAAAGSMSGAGASTSMSAGTSDAASVAPETSTRSGAAAESGCASASDCESGAPTSGASTSAVSASSESARSASALTSAGVGDGTTHPAPAAASANAHAVPTSRRWAGRVM